MNMIAYIDPRVIGALDDLKTVVAQKVDDKLFGPKPIAPKVVASNSDVIDKINAIINATYHHSLCAFNIQF